jgi:hypothetical protein
MSEKEKLIIDKSGMPFILKGENSQEGEGLQEGGDFQEEAQEEEDSQEGEYLQEGDLGSETLNEEIIIDRWSMLVKNGQGKTEQVYKDTEDYIRQSKAPAVEFERLDIRPSFLEGVFGNKRTYIRVTNRDLDGYKMYIGARDYGRNLDLSWYVTFEPGLITRIIARIFFIFSRKPWSPNLNLFQQQDLTAYSTVVHHCFMDAIGKITKGTGQQIDTKSKGFLGIS